MPQLIRYLMKCFGESDMRDAADAAQSAFAELFAKWNTVRSPRAQISGEGCASGVKWRAGVRGGR
jgi:hypothetical protein